ncbi:hypothetical protein K488DRAFT_73527 [Vararia minispora EC-137]|uniref:Uncharacterized protein n=1 Tax=Vararia minispora EC-137 TaxID=1314806 RepID=A0ACB8QBU7_9AGAM|nr:hypothetical protein K488DRAFT_73527 [Vararia minispora EC-137]
MRADPETTSIDFDLSIKQYCHRGGFGDSVTPLACELTVLSNKITTKGRRKALAHYVDSIIQDNTKGPSIVTPKFSQLYSGLPEIDWGSVWIRNPPCGQCLELTCLRHAKSTLHVEMIAAAMMVSNTPVANSLMGHGERIGLVDAEGERPDAMHACSVWPAEHGSRHEVALES